MMLKCLLLNLQTIKYAGTWYESYKNQRYYRIVDAGLKCATEQYTIMDDSTLKVKKKGFFSL